MVNPATNVTETRWINDLFVYIRPYPSCDRAKPKYISVTRSESCDPVEIFVRSNKMF